MENTNRDYNLAVQRDSKGRAATKISAMILCFTFTTVSGSPCCPRPQALGFAVNERYERGIYAIFDFDHCILWCTAIFYCCKKECQ